MQNKKEAISITIDKDLIEDLDKLVKREGRSRSAIINAHLRHTVPVALGEKPLHEGLKPTTGQMMGIIREATKYMNDQLAKMRRRIEKLEEAST